MAGPARFDLRAQTLTRDEERIITERLFAGALIIYPTDTLYALGCRAMDGAAIGRLRLAKGREEGKPLPVIVADVEQARSLAREWPEAAARLAEAFWPGPLTLIIPAASNLPPGLLAGASGVAVRVPASDAARLLARLAGPLVATSANLAGATPCLTVDAAASAFPLATLAFDGGLLDGAPSTIVDVSGLAGSARVVREGRLRGAHLAEALGGSGLPTEG